MSWHGTNPVPPFVFDIGCMWTGGKSIEAKRCDDIEQQLAEHDLIAIVSRHDLFDVEYYLVEFTNDYGGGLYPTCGKIAKALDIPNEWVNLYTCEYNGRTVYAVKEEELNRKYKNCDGRLEWVEPFDFHKALSKYNTSSLIKEQLGKICKRVVLYLDDGLILLECHLSSDSIAEMLGISKDSVVDVSISFNELTHVIIVEEE